MIGIETREAERQTARAEESRGAGNGARAGKTVNALMYYACSNRAEARSIEAELKVFAEERAYRILGVYFDKRGRAPSTLLGLIDVFSRLGGALLLIPSREHISACGASVQAMLHHAARRGIRFVFADEAEAGKTGAAVDPDAYALRYLGFLADYHGFGRSGSCSKNDAGGIVDGRLPFGYVSDGGRIRADETAAAAVREAFTLFAQGMSVSEIGRAVRERFPSTVFPTRNQIYAMIGNERYIGLDRSGRRFPPIIENELWLAACNSQMRRGLRHGERVFVLSGVSTAGAGRLETEAFNSTLHAPSYRFSSGGMRFSVDAEALERAVLEGLEEPIAGQLPALRERCLELISMRAHYEKLAVGLSERVRGVKAAISKRCSIDAGGAEARNMGVREFDKLVSELKLAEIELCYTRALTERLLASEKEVDSFFGHMARLPMLSEHEKKYFIDILVRRIAIEKGMIVLSLRLPGENRLRIPVGIEADEAEAGRARARGRE